MTPLELAAANEAEAEGLQSRVVAGLKKEAQEIAEYAKTIPARLSVGVTSDRAGIVNPFIEKSVQCGLQLVEAKMRQITSFEARAHTLLEQAKLLREMSATLSTEPPPPAEGEASST